MPTPLVTVLIDTYNYGRFIEEAIGSVLSQDFPTDQVEILVVDDGSTDDTAERLKKYGSRIRYFCKPNGGQASAFNLGFQEANGEIVAWLDADDYFMPGKLWRIVEEFQKHPTSGMLYHSLLKLDKESSELQEFKTIEPFVGFLPDHKRKLLSYEVIGTSAMAFRRKLVDPLLPIPESIRLQADTFLGLLMVLVAPVIAMPEAFSVYRVHGQNLYHAEDQAIAAERQKRQTEMFLTIVKEAKVWAKRHWEQLRHLETRLFLRKWLLAFREAQFQFDPPGRFRFFWFLIQQNYTHRPDQTWKLTLFNYLYAPSALILGYNRAAWFYKTRGATMDALQRAMRTLLRAPHNSE